MKRNPSSTELERRDWVDEFFCGLAFLALVAFVACLLVAFNPPVGPR